jgi:capsular exopolysaccharide synthesis family protein
MIPKEGKTFVALNLACIFAMNRKKVLLIDADLRKPELHGWLKMNNQHGLSTCLAADDSAEKIITPSPVPNLDLILSGPVLPNPAEFIESQEFGFMLAGLKSRYDIIILDNGPQEMVTEGAVVMRHTDLDLFVVRRGYTPRSVFAGIHRAVDTGFNKAAIVFNDALTERSPGSSRRESQLFELEYFTDAPLMDFKKSR